MENPMNQWMITRGTPMTWPPFKSACFGSSTRFKVSRWFGQIRKKRCRWLVDAGGVPLQLASVMLCQFPVLSSMSCCWHAVGRHTIRSSNMATAVAGKCWETPFKWRFIAGKIIYKWVIFHCHVCLPEGQCLHVYQMDLIDACRGARYQAG